MFSFCLDEVSRGDFWIPRVDSGSGIIDILCSVCNTEVKLITEETVGEVISVGCDGSCSACQVGVPEVCYKTIWSELFTEVCWWCSHTKRDQGWLSQPYKSCCAPRWNYRAKPKKMMKTKSKSNQNCYVNQFYLCQRRSAEGDMSSIFAHCSNAFFEAQQWFIDRSSLQLCLSISLHSISAALVTSQIDQRKL